MRNCRLATLMTLVGAAHLHILGALALIAAAIIANGSFFGAPASVALMTSAAALALAGLGPLIAALVHGFDLRQNCFMMPGLQQKCTPQLNLIMGFVSGLVIVCALVPPALMAAVFGSAIPFLGSFAMSFAATLLVAALGLLVSIDVVFSALVQCARVSLPGTNVAPQPPVGIDFQALTCPQTDTFCSPRMLGNLVPATKLGPTRFDTGGHFALIVRATAGFALTAVEAFAHQDGKPQTQQKVEVLLPGDISGLPDAFVVLVNGSDLNFSWGLTPGVPTIIHVLLVCQTSSGTQNIFVQAEV